MVFWEHFMHLYEPFYTFIFLFLPHKRTSKSDFTSGTPIWCKMYTFSFFYSMYVHWSMYNVYRFDNAPHSIKQTWSHNEKIKMKNSMSLQHGRWFLKQVFPTFLLNTNLKFIFYSSCLQNNAYAYANANYY